ncbi:helix-turn-helix transcriptional regulator [Diaphorobacter nitroreducens]|uniref:helix-turn-helix transcriptional regulator n=1 Tax=Diaphorobacter nitroreducens TaxID=164759 RepID=UPI0028A23C4A|nr:hypothetical protein [Diaphorobacter nitroreducens]
MTTLQTTSPRVDTAGIAAMLGCTRHHVTARLTKRPDFPAPIINLSQKMRYWRTADVLAYIQGKRQPRS